MKANRARWPIITMARLLGVSTSGYYAWLVRKPSRRACSDAQLLARIRTVHASSRGTYGAPRIHAQLAREGVHVGRKRVARLMRMAGLCGASRRRWKVTTRPRAGARRAPDLVRRHFSAQAPNVLWVADATYIPTGEGFLYLAVVLDVFSRRIVGWAMSNQRPLPSGSVAATRACSPRWGRPATASTMPCASRSSAHSKQSCSCANTSTRMRRHGVRSLPGSKVVTTRGACTAASATVHRSNSKT